MAKREKKGGSSLFELVLLLACVVVWVSVLYSAAPTDELRESYEVLIPETNVPEDFQLVVGYIQDPPSFRGISLEEYLAVLPSAQTRAWYGQSAGKNQAETVYLAKDADGQRIVAVRAYRLSRTFYVVKTAVISDDEQLRLVGELDERKFVGFAVLMLAVVVALFLFIVALKEDIATRLAQGRQNRATSTVSE